MKLEIGRSSAAQVITMYFDHVNKWDKRVL